MQISVHFGSNERGLCGRKAGVRKNSHKVNLLLQPMGAQLQRFH